MWVAFKFITLWSQTTAMDLKTLFHMLWVAFKFVTLWSQTTQADSEGRYIELWVAFKFVTLWSQTTKLPFEPPLLRLWVAFKFVTLWSQTTSIFKRNWLSVGYHKSSKRKNLLFYSILGIKRKVFRFLKFKKEWAEYNL